MTSLERETVSGKGRGDSSKVAADTNEDIYEKMEENKEYTRIIQVMKTNATKKDVLANGCKILSRLARESKELREIISTSGGRAVVVGVMNTFNTDVEVQVDACMALAQLAHHDDNKCELLVANEHVRPVVEAMRNFEESAEMQAAACHVLGTLAYKSYGNCEAIADSNGIDRVLQAMKTFQENVNVVKKICYALGTLAYTDRNKEIIGSSNGIQVVVRAMEKFDNDAEVQQWGCHALANYAFNSPKRKEIIGSSNGAQLVIRAMETWKNNVAVQKNGCHALGALAVNVKNAKIIGSCNGIQVVVRAMEIWEDNAEAQQVGCDALGKMSRKNRANKVTVAESGGIARICKAIRKYANSTTVKCAGNRALRYIVHGDAKITKLRLALTFAFPPIIQISEIDAASVLRRTVRQQHDKRLVSELYIAHSIWYSCFMLKCTRTGLYNAHGSCVLARIFRFQFRGAQRPFPILHADAFRAQHEGKLAAECKRQGV